MLSFVLRSLRAAALTRSLVFDSRKEANLERLHFSAKVVAAQLEKVVGAHKPPVPVSAARPASTFPSRSRSPAPTPSAATPAPPPAQITVSHDGSSVLGEGNLCESHLVPSFFLVTLRHVYLMVGEDTIHGGKLRRMAVTHVYIYIRQWKNYRKEYLRTHVANMGFKYLWIQ